MRTKFKLFLQGVGSVLDIYPSEIYHFRDVRNMIKSDSKKSDEYLLKSDWEEIGKDFDKIIPR